VLQHAHQILMLPQIVRKYWTEPYGDRRQEIVFIGNRTMRQKRITDSLDGALLTEAEFKRGPKAWAKLEDPIAVLSDEDVMEFVEFDEEHEHDEEILGKNAVGVAAVKRGRSSSKPNARDQAPTDTSGTAAKKQTKALSNEGVAGIRRSSRTRA
jgi:hypothetical protein